MNDQTEPRQDRAPEPADEGMDAVRRDMEADIYRRADEEDRAPEPEKPCRGCGRVLLLTEFYRHSRFRDGHDSRCKACTDARTARYAEQHRDQVRAMNRRSEQRNPAVKAERRRRYALEHPERVKAMGAVKRALQAGRLIRPQSCEACGLTGRRIEAHHDDYDKQLDVQWLCKPCHERADDVRSARV